MTNVWLSVFCCRLFPIEEGTPAEAEAKRKGLIIVPPELVDEVNEMTLPGRRRWFLSQTAVLSDTHINTTS